MCSWGYYNTPGVIDIDKIDEVCYNEDIGWKIYGTFEFGYCAE